MTDVPRTTPADQAWAAAAELGRIIAEQRAAKRQATKDARNARRRARYRANPRPAKARVPVVVDDGEDAFEAACRCYIVAPCVFCESGGAEATA
jgi:hypothetical protein